MGIRRERRKERASLFGRIARVHKGCHCCYFLTRCGTFREAVVRTYVRKRRERCGVKAADLRKGETCSPLLHTHSHTFRAGSALKHYLFPIANNRHRVKGKRKQTQLRPDRKQPPAGNNFPTCNSVSLNITSSEPVDAHNPIRSGSSNRLQIRSYYLGLLVENNLVCSLNTRSRK